jgi:hypothetical protein
MMVGEKSGEVGQEVYGAGLPFGIIPRQYIKLMGTEAMTFIDYPFANFRQGKNVSTFQLLGHSEMQCSLKIIGISKAKSAKIMVETKAKAKYQK